MAKVTRYRNYRVVVVPRTPVSYGLPDNHRGWIERCDEIAASIRRHIDNVGTPLVACDTADVCSFCGEPWDAGEYAGPVCCVAADEEHEREQARCKRHIDEIENHGKD